MLSWRLPKPAGRVRAKHIQFGVSAVDAVENFFGIFKRGMRGTYTFCEEQHLQRF
jgi:hypothetical protein